MKTENNQSKLREIEIIKRKGKRSRKNEIKSAEN